MSSHTHGNTLLIEAFRLRVIAKPYSAVRAIFAELGESDTTLLRALRIGHGIEFDSLHEDPMLYFVVSSEQEALLRESGIASPTFLQLLGSCEVIGLDCDEAVARFKAMKKGEA